MKISALLILLFFTTGCDPYGFGYKYNPAYVLDESFKAISNQDLESFLEVTAKEALCVYGNEEGLTYLKENLQIIPENVKLNPKMLETRHYDIPVFAGYWSYYHERYEIEVLDKSTKEVILETIVDCEFGAEGEKRSDLINRQPGDYNRKECRAVKLLPKKFNSLPVPSKCGLLKVEL